MERHRSKRGALWTVKDAGPLLRVEVLSVYSSVIFPNETKSAQSYIGEEASIRALSL